MNWTGAHKQGTTGRVDVNQIITLLTNLFNLTKVASVTLPGLLAALGLALVLWPAVPVDVIPAVVSIAAPSPPPARVGAQACEIQHWVVDDVVRWMETQPLSPENRGDIQNIGPTHPGGGIPPRLTQNALQQILGIERQAGNLTVPESRKRAILEQFVLDYEVQSLSICADLEKSWAGLDDLSIQQLTIDIENLEKQRSAAQDNYLASLKANSRSLAGQYEGDMRRQQDKIDEARDNILRSTQDKKERERRAAELGVEQQLIKDRLGDPGRLRPRVGFDLFVTGLINHVVAFILLSLAAAVIVTAFDRALFGSVFEDLFDGF